MTQQPKWIVTVSDSRPVADVAKDLSAAGLAVEQVLAEIGSISGRGSAAVAAALRGIPGVVDVAPDTGVDIGPPGSDHSW
jgi:hypothetical protein